MFLQVVCIPLLHDLVLYEFLESVSADIRLKASLADPVGPLLLRNNTVDANFIISKFALMDQSR